MTTGLFVTGTDTGVGKTWVTCALARQAVARGSRVFAFKPIETGCALVGGQLVGDDQELLCAAAGGWQMEDLRGVYRFSLPAAPLVAAQAEARVIELDRIAASFGRGASGADLVLVEAAGGWRVPLTVAGDTSALARAVGLPVLVVARAGLGTINHTLLTVEAIERDGLMIAAVVLNQREGDDPAFTASNQAQIARSWGGRVLVGDQLDQLILPDVCF